MEKSSDAFRTISEVAEELELPQHVLRFWETRFPRIRPLKRAGGRRYYRPTDVLLLRTIRQLLYEDGYTIKGVQRLLKEQGAKSLRDGDASFASGLEEIDPADTPGEESAASTSSCPAAAAPRHALPPSTGPGTRAALLDMLAMIEDCTRILDDLGREE